MYERIDPTGFKLALKATLETRGQTVWDLVSRKRIVNGSFRKEDLDNNLVIGSVDEMVGYLFAAIHTLTDEEKRRFCESFVPSCRQEGHV